MSTASSLIRGLFVRPLSRRWPVWLLLLAVALGAADGALAKVSKPTDLVENDDEVGGDVDEEGELVLPDKDSDVSLRSDSAEDQRIRLPKDRKQVFRNQNASLTVTDTVGGAVVVTRKVNGKTLVELASGTAKLEAGDDTVPIPLVRRPDGKVSVLTGASKKVAPVVLMRRDADGGSTAFVDSGDAELRSVTATAVSGSSNGNVYAGETVSLGNDGSVKRLRLGSLDGDRGLPGDPLSGVPGLANGVKVPNLQGQVGRLGAGTNSLLDLIRRQLDLRFGQPGTQRSTLSFNAGTGVLTYSGKAGRAYLMPLGDVAVAGNGFAASNAGSTVSGSFALTDRGVQLTLTSALGYFSEFDAAVKALDPTGKLTLSSTGVLWVDALGSSFVVQPAVNSQNVGITGQPSIGSSSDGLLYFRDSQGGQQVLYPTLADAASLQTSLQTVDPAASLSLPGDGTAVLSVSGRSYVFVPDYTVPPTPSSHAADPWWLDSNGALNYATSTSRGGRHQWLRGR
jgi:hypothetical protein